MFFYLINEGNYRNIKRNCASLVIVRNFDGFRMGLFARSAPYATALMRGGRGIRFQGGYLHVVPHMQPRTRVCGGRGVIQGMSGA